MSVLLATRLTKSLRLLQHMHAHIICISGIVSCTEISTEFTIYSFQLDWRTKQRKLFHCNSRIVCLISRNSKGTKLLMAIYITSTIRTVKNILKFSSLLIKKLVECVLSIGFLFFNHFYYSTTAAPAQSIGLELFDLSIFSSPFIWAIFTKIFTLQACTLNHLRSLKSPVWMA